MTNAPRVYCWIAKIYQSITAWKKVGYYYYDSPGVARKAVEIAQKKEQ